jgi:hypothetical protein
MPPEGDDHVGDLVRRFAPADTPGDDDCPDANALAAYVSGTGPERERRAIEAHVLTCEVCRSVLLEAGAAARATDTGAPVASAGEWRSSRLAIAAAVLLALGGGLAAFLLWGRPGGPPDSNTALASAAATLRSGRPDLFAGFEPLSDTERTGLGPTRLRSGWGILRPAGTVRPGPVTVEWTPAPGAVGYDVSVGVEGEEPLWRQAVGNVTSVVPPDAAQTPIPGTKYAVRILTRGPLGRSAVTRWFTVAGAEEEARFVEGLGEIRRLAPPAEQPLLAAHWALRRNFVLEAERLLLERLSTAPDDADARDLLRHTLRWLGVPEGD